MIKITVGGIGELVEEADLNYATARKSLKRVDADFSRYTSEKLVYSRTCLGRRHFVSKKGGITLEEMIYNVEGFKNPVLMLEPGPIYYNPKIATYCHSLKNNNGNKPKLFKKNQTENCEFRINDTAIVLPMNLRTYGKTWTEVVSKIAREKTNHLETQAFELPFHESFKIPVEELLSLENDKLSDPAYFKQLSKEAQVAVMLWKQNAKHYAEKVLKPSRIDAVPFLILDEKTAKSRNFVFSRPLWNLGTKDWHGKGWGCGLHADDYLFYDKMGAVYGLLEKN